MDGQRGELISGGEPVAKAAAQRERHVGQRANGRGIVGHADPHDRPALNWPRSGGHAGPRHERRRKEVGGTQDASFFDVRNEEAYSIRKQLAEGTMLEMFDWLESDGHIAIFDATNTTKERRHWVQELCLKHDVAPIFLEIICTDQSMIEANILAVKLKSPDYVTAASAAEATRDPR
jgi:hypothetical protein